MIDTHCHLYDKKLINDLDDIVNNAQNENITKMICIGDSIETSKQSIQISETYNQIYASFFQQSSLANYAIATERNVIKVNNDNIPLELLGPLGCGIQTGAGAALNSLKVNTGNSLVVFGAGSVGLSAIMAANIVGCNNLVAVDINNERLNIAQ